jgi:hypothetical protein
VSLPHVLPSAEFTENLTNCYRCPKKAQVSWPCSSERSWQNRAVWLRTTMKQLFQLFVLALYIWCQDAGAAEASAEGPRVLIVVAKAKDLDANHYLWAAEVAAARLPGKNNQVVEGGLAAALKEVREKPGTVRGIVEIVVNVYAWDEDVRIACLDVRGKEVWKKKSSMNAGGSEEDLARKMFERTLQKAENMPECGSN